MGPWGILLLAGALEIVWALSMKASNGFTHVGYSILTGVVAFFGFWLLAMAMKDLPVGTAYAVWVGIGAVGTAVFGIIWFHDSITVLRIAGIALIVAGVTALKISSN
ncbi:MAG: multidrug efflux SMR transporter [Rhodobacteraceae bacterium]|nr:multidrug efflux SMR transporter [Paracoccaceae bacterium]